MHLLKIYCVAPENIHTQPKEGYREFQGEAISKAYIFFMESIIRGFKPKTLCERLRGKLKYFPKHHI